MIPLAEFVRTTPFFVIAHRGASGVAPENTLLAIRKALEGGAAMVEIDVQATSDKHLVVFHDHVLGRTTNGHGHIRNTTLAAIRELDAGAWFDGSTVGERVPLLDEALDMIDHRAYLNVEIKPRNADPHAQDIARALVDVFRLRELLPYAVFSSFDHQLLADLKTMDASVHTCALNVPDDHRLPSKILSACGADAFGCSLRELTHARARDCASHQIPWGVYTVNTPDQLAHARSFGVQAVVSNFPSSLVQ